MSRSGPLEKIDAIQSTEQAADDKDATITQLTTQEKEPPAPALPDAPAIAGEEQISATAEEEPSSVEPAAAGEEEPSSIKEPAASAEAAAIPVANVEAVSPAIEEAVAARTDETAIGEPAAEEVVAPSTGKNEESQPATDKVASSIQVKPAPRSSRVAVGVKLWPT